MSEEWGFYFDATRCLGCHACAISCKNRHGVDSGKVDWRRVETVQTGEFPNVREQNFSISCMHCKDAPCEKVCPADAITKRESDGIVTVDQDACIGCHYCGWACPYGAPQYGEDGLMQKCNLCLDRGVGSGVDAPAKHEQDEPLEPACVDECVGGALHAGPIDELLSQASKEAAERFHRDGRTQVIVESAADGSEKLAEEESAD
jgi:anaerobic dimethyl sulfoxide reductase subunit B (iron-sulfur subunit)